MLPEVIAVFGPTASGKSAVAEILADRLDTAVVSADAMQVYRGLPILTNQPAHSTRLVAMRDLSQEMSVGEYAALAHAAIDQVVAAHGAAIVAGGTGLYLRAALAELDSRAADAVHPNDRRRIVRALELAEAGSSLVTERARLWSEDVRRPTLVAGLAVPREVLDAWIEQRTNEMFARGVVDEVRQALERPISRTAEKALGLRELSELPPALARGRIVERTRRYAAYQRKWMRRIPGIVMIEAHRPADEVADEILEVARAR